MSRPEAEAALLELYRDPIDDPDTLIAREQELLEILDAPATPAEVAA